MTFLNEGQADRGVRMLAGVLLIAAGWALSLNTLGIVLVAIGGLSLQRCRRRTTGDNPTRVAKRRQPREAG